MELVHVSVIHCRLLLHVLAAPKTLVEFQESQSLPLSFVVGPVSYHLEKSRWSRVGTSKIILDFYPVNCLVR